MSNLMHKPLALHQTCRFIRTHSVCYDKVANHSKFKRDWEYWL